MASVTDPAVSASAAVGTAAQTKRGGVTRRRDWRENAAGYLFIGIAHRGRDQASREQMCTHFGVPLTIECAQVNRLWTARPIHTTF